MRKNKDWCVTLEEGVSKKVVELFFEECELKPLAEDSVSYYNEWGLCKHKKIVYFKGLDVPLGREFILPSQWKEAKEYICEEEKKELEVGKWYKFENQEGSSVGRFSRKSEFSIYLYDYMFNKKRYNEENFVSTRIEHLVIELTQEEKEKHLIACAKARGFKKGVKVGSIKRKDLGRKTLGLTIKHNSNLFKNIIEEEEEVLLIGGSSVWSKSGGWAEIVKDELPEINGYSGEFTSHLNGGEFVKYGCAEFTIKSLQKANSLLKYSNRDISSITLCSGVTITMEQIEQIIKAYENK